MREKIRGSWVLTEKLSATEREKLAILLETAGYEVGGVIRSTNSITQQYPYFCTDIYLSESLIYTTRTIKATANCQGAHDHKFTLQELQNYLIQRIKQQIKEV